MARVDKRATLADAAVVLALPGGERVRTDAALLRMSSPTMAAAMDRSSSEPPP